MRILNIKGTDRATAIAKIEEVYGKNYIIMKESEKNIAGFLGLFPKKEFTARVMIKEPRDGNLTEQQYLFMNTTQPETTIDLRKDTLVNANQMSEATINNETMDLFMKLKKQLDSIQDFMKESKKDNENALINTLIEFLKKERVDQELIDKIIGRLGNDPGVSEIMSVLEGFIRDCCKVSSVKEEKIKVFVGTTGVGKTTTIAKITADLVLNHSKKVALFTSDTYRIAAVEQLNTYADIFQIPIEILYPEDDVDAKLKKQKDKDCILIDTAGRSYKNKEQMDDIKKLLEKIPKKNTYLVINANTPFEDAKKIIDLYKEIQDDLEFIVTKTDETETIGNLLNIIHYTKKPISYITFGQEVPSDFETFKESSYVERFLERIEV